MYFVAPIFRQSFSVCDRSSLISIVRFAQLNLPANKPRELLKASAGALCVYPIKRT